MRGLHHTTSSGWSEWRNSAATTSFASIVAALRPSSHPVFFTTNNEPLLHQQHCIPRMMFCWRWMEDSSVHRNQEDEGAGTNWPHNAAPSLFARQFDTSKIPLFHLRLDLEREKVLKRGVNPIHVKPLTPPPREKRQLVQNTNQFFNAHLLTLCYSKMMFGRSSSSPHHQGCCSFL